VAGEGSHQDDETPPLLLAQTFFEGRHGLLPYRDLVKDFAVSEFAHALGVGQVGRRRMYIGI
jgi:hypothetical protein